MKAVIMAGGEGSRLRPLTCDTPKPLCTLLGKPVIFYILELLKRHGIQEAAVTLGYQGSRLESALKDYEDMEIRFSREEKPLGTAGGVRNAVREGDGGLIVISGDAMCDFDLTAAMEFHARKDAAVTIITHRVADPREYGLVDADESGRVAAFVEKPSYAGCTTDLANTGVYLLSQEAVGLIEEGKPSDFAKDVFPRMLSAGMPIYTFEDTGYWCDIGDIRSYIRCQGDMLAGKVKFETNARQIGGNLCAGRLPAGNYRIHPPVYIGEDVSIGENTVVEAGSVLEDHVRIGENCRIRGSILLAGVSTGDHVTLNGMAAGEGAAFEDGSSAYELSVAGQNCRVGRDASLGEAVRVWPGKTVEEGTALEEDLRSGYAREIVIGDEGITGQTNVTLTPALCTRIGAGVASLADYPAVGVGYGSRTGGAGGRNAGQMLALACISGVLSAGANVWDFGECMETQFAFCMSKSQVDFGIYVDSGLTAEIRITQQSGMPLKREFERKLESAVNRKEFKRAAPGETGSVNEIRSLPRLYPYELMKLCNAPLDRISARVKSPSGSAEAMLRGILDQLGCHPGELTVQLSADGKNVSVSDREITFSHERVLAAVCLGEFLKGESVALPRSAPKIIDRIAQQYGGRVYRYSECPCGPEDDAFRGKAAAKPWLRDGMMLAVKLLSFLAEQGITLRELEKMVPEFNVTARLVAIPGNPSAVVRRLREKQKARGTLSDGIELECQGANAYLRPMKSGKGILILTESLQSETAMELCDRFEAVVREAALDRYPVL